MRFTADDLSDAYVTLDVVNKSEGACTFKDACTNEHCLKVIDSLSATKRKNFFKMLEQAIKEIPFPVDGSEYDSVEDYDEANSEFHARLEDYCSEFM